MLSRRRYQNPRVIEPNEWTMCTSNDMYGEVVEKNEEWLRGGSYKKEEQDKCFIHGLIWTSKGERPSETAVLYKKKAIQAEYQQREEGENGAVLKAIYLWSIQVPDVMVLLSAVFEARRLFGRFHGSRWCFCVNWRIPQGGQEREMVSWGCTNNGDIVYIPEKLACRSRISWYDVFFLLPSYVIKNQELTIMMTFSRSRRSRIPCQWTWALWGTSVYLCLCSLLAATRASFHVSFVLLVCWSRLDFQIR